MGLHLEDTGLGRRAVNAGADHVFGAQFAIYVYPQPLLADADDDAFIRHDRVGQQIIPGGDFDHLPGNQGIWIDAGIGIDDHPVRDAHLPAYPEHRVTRLDGVVRWGVTDPDPGVCTGQQRIFQLS